MLLCEQNIEHLLWRQRATLAGDDARREAFHLHEQATRQAEHAAWLRADLCATVTETDRQLMQTEMPALQVTVVPDGVDHSSSVTFTGEQPSPQITRDCPSIVLVGNFGYQPNVDAAMHMCTALFPRIKGAVPDAHLLLVGGSPPAELRRTAAATGSVTVTGEVDEVEPYLTGATVVALPLRIGGGIKVKVLDALRCGSAIVTTPIGAQGLDRQTLGAMLVASDDDGFAEAVVQLINSPSKRELLRHAAARAVQQLPTWDDAGRALLRAYEDLLDTSTRVAA
ncbi:MAG: glycosyltransferase family 4 protein [Gaiellaceae bacterium]